MINIYSKISKRIKLFVAFFTLAWIGLVIRLFIIQIVEAPKYQAKCNQQAHVKKEIPASRGTIYDRRGKPITFDIVTYSIAAHPYLIKDKEALARKLAEDLKGDFNKYLEILKTNKTFVWIERSINQENFNNVQYYENYPGLIVEKKIRRHYPLGEINGPVVGFTNPDNKGLAGIEYEFDSYLSGKPGWKTIQRDGLGRYFSRPDLPSQPPIDGNDIYLTIDQTYQSILYEELTRAQKETHAEKVLGLIIDPNTGEVLAMANVPSFDPNNYYRYPPSALKNYVVSDIFEPGSTFKIVAATAALEQKLINPNHKIDCSPGFIKVTNRIIRDHHQYGILTFADIIKNSSNVGTIKVAQIVGRELIFNYIRRYGFGMRTDIQFPGEESGILHPLKKWSDLTLAQVSIGQGIAVNALQVALAYSAIANGGVLLKPQLVKKIQTKSGISIYECTPTPIRRVASEETMAILREMLRLTVKSGTGRNAEIQGLAIAGKTGTAQKVINGRYSQSNYVASFVGFFPVKRPKLLCIVVIDDPKGAIHTGGGSAAPVVREIFKRILTETDDIFFEEEPPKPQHYADNMVKQISSHDLYENNDDEIKLLTANYIKIMPDLSGKTLRQSLAILQMLGIKNVSVEGAGIVVFQMPAPNTPINENTFCRLKLKPVGLQVD